MGRSCELSGWGDALGVRSELSCVVLRLGMGRVVVSLVSSGFSSGERFVWFSGLAGQSIDLWWGWGQWQTVQIQ